MHTIKYEQIVNDFDETKNKEKKEQK